MKLAGGELVEHKSVVGLMRQRFLESAFGVGVASEVLQLQTPQDLRRNAGGVIHQNCGEGAMSGREGHAFYAGGGA